MHKALSRTNLSRRLLPGAATAVVALTVVAVVASSASSASTSNTAVATSSAAVGTSSTSVAATPAESVDDPNVERVSDTVDAIHTTFVDDSRGRTIPVTIYYPVASGATRW